MIQKGWSFISQLFKISTMQDLARDLIYLVNADGYFVRSYPFMGASEGVWFITHLYQHLLYLPDAWFMLASLHLKSYPRTHSLQSAISTSPALIMDAVNAIVIVAVVSLDQSC
jgi:hypothetical protein